MTTTDREQTTMKPEEYPLGDVVWDTGKDVPGVVMEHLGGDRVQLRPILGGKEWDAYVVRPLTQQERMRTRLSERNEASRLGL